MKKWLTGLSAESMLVLADRCRGSAAYGHQLLWRDLSAAPRDDSSSLCHYLPAPSKLLLEYWASAVDSVKPAFTFSEFKKIVSSHLSWAIIITLGDSKQMIRLTLPCPVVDPPHCYLGEKHLEASSTVHKKTVGVRMERWFIVFVSTWVPWLFVIVVMIYE